MKHTLLLFVLLSLISFFGFAQIKYDLGNQFIKDSSNFRLPNTVMPELANWFWFEKEFMTEGYKEYLDKVSKHSTFGLVSVSIRMHRRELTEDSVHTQLKLAANYALAHGIGLTADLDVRAARRYFEAHYPDELQEMLILREVDLSNSKLTNVVVKSHDISDHYTGRTVHYIPLKSQLLRVYNYARDENGIEMNSLIDITKSCKITYSSKDSIVIELPKTKFAGSTKACVLTSFTHLSPDVFAPHLLSFQREIINRFRDIPLAGVFKDEWGFPLSHDKTHTEIWYSKFRAEDYAKRTNGHDLLYDCLIMKFGWKGELGEQQKAINYFMAQSLERNQMIEDDFYHAVKESFGPNAVILAHPTWWPFPNQLEYTKNGLNWWSATRDWAQTDEVTPFAVRTALSKKWGSAVWYNMYYSSKIEDYPIALWSSALGGGRISYHPIFPSTEKNKNIHFDFLTKPLLIAESRIRLLNFISQAPLDCRVAVIFGHANTMNWAGAQFDDPGMDLVSNLWREGVATDLIPTSEIKNGSVKIDKDGYVYYGKQRYDVVILYHPEFEENTTGIFFSNPNLRSTRLFKLGSWTKNFDAEPINSLDLLPKKMSTINSNTEVVSEVLDIFKSKKIELQSPAILLLKGFNSASNAPPTTGFCYLTDGTLIQIAATQNNAGDPIHSSVVIKNRTITFDAEGLAAARLDEQGNLVALAAGGLRSFSSGTFALQIKEPLDLAIWKDENEIWHGVIQGAKGKIPVELLEITKDWVQLEIPTPMIIE